MEHGEEIASIYCRDERNTDNAWVETTCVNFHDESGRLTSKLAFEPGRGVIDVNWFMIHGGWKLFASHRHLLALVAKNHDAYF